MFIVLPPSILTTTVGRFSSPTEQKGISTRFLGFINSIDSTIGQKALGPDQTISGKVQSSVSGGISQARSFNEQKGVTKKVGDVRASPIVRPHVVLTIVAQYYTGALNTSFGSKVQAFYTTTAKRVHDIHEEAKRLAGWNKTNAAEPVPAEAEPSSKSA